MRSRPVSVVLGSLALILLISGCSGASPESRARQTRTAQLGSQTPIPRAAGVFVGIDEERAVMLTAEAFLPIATPPILVGTVAATREAVMTELELTEELIAAAMAKAEAQVCAGTDRCFAFPTRLADARVTCTPKARCRVGWVIPASGRTSWDVWLEVRTGRITLIPRTNA